MFKKNESIEHTIQQHFSQDMGFFFLKIFHNSIKTILPTSLRDCVSDLSDVFLLEHVYVTTLKRLMLGYIYNT